MSTTYPTKTHYSEHFSRRELECRCGCETPLSVQRNLTELAVYLEKLRALLGVPMHVHCAHRCRPHNAAIGGAPASQHIEGTACDFSTRKHTPKQTMAVAAKITRFYEGGLHAYPWGTHVDIGPGPRRW